MLRSRRGRVAAILAGGALAALTVPFAVPAASANTLASSPTSLETVGGVSSGAPYASGQGINIVVSPNNTLSLSNLESNGYSGEPAMKMEECADPDGTAANLPTLANECDGSTELTTSAVNADGSFEYDGYHVFALPDINLGENGSHAPVCGDTGATACVLSIGPSPTNFSLPHVFSPVFYVTPSSGDGGTPAGDGSTISFTSSAPGNLFQSVSIKKGSAPGPSSYTPSASSPDGAPTFSIVSGQCSSDGTTISFSGGGTCVISADQAGNQSATQSVSVGGITSGNSATATAGSSFNFPVTASGSPKWKEVGKLPKGVKFIKGQGFSGTPATGKHSSVGTYNVTIEAEYKTGSGKSKAIYTATQAFQLVVA